MIILGIDPGLVHTGWGVIEKDGSRLKYIAEGTISPPVKKTLPERLAFIYEGLQKVFEQYIPEITGVEEVFSNVNPKTTLLLGQARGIALLTPALFKSSVMEISATMIKKSVVGTGHASKDQIQMMANILLGGKIKNDSEHSADALAIAITTAHLS
ncbi:MAG: crossover junction endodeoxyribonuclease RuvC [Alphaproteobacteria bacterium]|nr:crossover junction endodeoxyribonuclease RuvC [Alphaproteobacteria bacterium]